MRKLIRRIACAAGFHRFELLYRDTGSHAMQYVPEWTCLFCAKVDER